MEDGTCRGGVGLWTEKAQMNLLFAAFLQLFMLSLAENESYSDSAPSYFSHDLEGAQ